MGKEIERKYLVTSGEWRKEAGKGEPYRQGYLCDVPERSVRIRIAGKGSVYYGEGQFIGIGAR